MISQICYIFTQAFNSNLEVSNFPMRERSQEMIKLIETITKRRQIEIAEAKVILTTDFSNSFL